MKRPVLIATIGFIIGIIGELYFSKGTIPIFLCMFFLLLLLMNKNVYRYVKVCVSINAIILLLLSFFIALIYTKIESNRYNSIVSCDYKNLIGVIQSEKVEKKYTYCYRVLIKEINESNDISFMLYIKKKNGTKEFEYGDVISIDGKLELPETQRNYGGYDQSNYYKSQKLYGNINAEKVKIIKEGSNSLFKLITQIRKRIKENFNNYFSKNNSSVLIAMLLGDKSDIDDETIELFKDSSLIHILCVSGAHITLLISFIFVITSKLGRNIKYILSLIVLALFMCIIGFSASAARACLMGCMLIISKLVFRKNDTFNSISISLLIILIFNPFSVFDIGLMLTYSGTLGIVLFAKVLDKMFNNSSKIKSYIVRTLIVSVSAQIGLLPIIAFNFYSIYPFFFLSSLIATPIFSFIVILGFLFLIFSFMLPAFCNLIKILLMIFTILLTSIAKTVSLLPFAKIYIIRPSILIIVIYYMILCFIRYLISLYEKDKIKRLFERKLKRKINKLKSKITFKSTITVLIILFIISQIINYIPSSFNIFFIDVGQGDCTLVQTPNHKTIMIDSGGSENLEEYDVGKQVLLPYLLARKIKKIDYIMISHFHADHCNGFIAILNDLKVGTMLIAKQETYTKETQAILNLAKEKNVKIHYVKEDEKIRIDNNTFLEILYIGKDKENLNNSSIIAKATYNNFAAIFTGDSA